MCTGDEGGEKEVSYKSLLLLNDELHFLQHEMKQQHVNIVIKEMKAQEGYMNTGQASTHRKHQYWYCLVQSMFTCKKALNWLARLIKCHLNATE